jgi:hypothetical protein
MWDETSEQVAERADGAVQRNGDLKESSIMRDALDEINGDHSGVNATIVDVTAVDLRELIDEQLE